MSRIESHGHPPHPRLETQTGNKWRRQRNKNKSESNNKYFAILFCRQLIFFLFQRRNPCDYEWHETRKYTRLIINIHMYMVRLFDGSIK